MNIAQSEIFLLLVAGLVLQRNQGTAAAELDPIVDVGLSIIMIALTVAIMLGFVLLGIRYLR
jgi:hypothetical protein